MTSCQRNSSTLGVKIVLGSVPNGTKTLRSAEDVPALPEGKPLTERVVSLLAGFVRSS